MMHLKKGFFTRINKSEFEGKNYIGAFSNLYNCQMRFGSYCGSNCRLINVRIGKFCSIASGVKILFGNHPSKKWVSTFPGFYSPNTPNNLSFSSEKRFEEYTYVDSEQKIFVSIGNDVWIASDVSIMAGVNIGDGAIVAAGSIVTKDVKPYSIVGGIPAKEIGYRFNHDDVQYLLDNKWWDNDIEWIKKNACYFSDLENYKSIMSNNRDIV